MDRTARGFAMRINAKKTKVMLVGKGESRLSTNITISGGPMERVDSFKYLGGILVANNNLEAEVDARTGRGVRAFTQIFRFFYNKHLRVGAKMKMFNAFFLPHFLYDSETWNMMHTQ